jgi:hypothetical protein
VPNLHTSRRETTLSPAEFTALMEGIDLSRARRLPRWNPSPAESRVRRLSTRSGAVTSRHVGPPSAYAAGQDDCLREYALELNRGYPIRQKFSSHKYIRTTVTIASQRKIFIKVLTEIL